MPYLLYHHLTPREKGQLWHHHIKVLRVYEGHQEYCEVEIFSIFHIPQTQQICWMIFLKLLPGRWRWESVYGVKVSNWKMVLEHPAVVVFIVWKTELQKWKIPTALVINFLEISCLVLKFSLLLTVLKKFREKEYLSWASGISFHHKMVMFLWKDGFEARI